MTEDQLREAMMASVPERLRPRKFRPRTNGWQDRRIDHDKVVAMKAEGLPAYIIAKRVSAKPNTIREILRRHRLQTSKEV